MWRVRTNMETKIGTVKTKMVGIYIKPESFQEIIDTLTHPSNTSHLHRKRFRICRALSSINASLRVYPQKIILLQRNCAEPSETQPGGSTRTLRVTTFFLPSIMSLSWLVVNTWSGNLNVESEGRMSEWGLCLYTLFKAVMNPLNNSSMCSELFCFRLAILCIFLIRKWWLQIEWACHFHCYKLP